MRGIILLPTEKKILEKKLELNVPYGNGFARKRIADILRIK